MILKNWLKEIKYLYLQHSNMKIQTNKSEKLIKKLDKQIMEQNKRFKKLERGVKKYTQILLKQNA